MRPNDDKYFVISRGELSRLQDKVDRGQAGTAKHLLSALYINQIEDAVVIRKQDIFAPPALDAYANAIQCVVEALTETEDSEANHIAISKKVRILQNIADYFRMQAEDAYSMKRKLPD